MSGEITLILESDNGNLTTEVSGINTALLTELQEDLGKSENVNCGKPPHGRVVQITTSTDPTSGDDQSIWVYRIYHGSVVDGPGRRSVVQVAGCSIRCPGCYVPETHDRLNGQKIRISDVISEILSEAVHSDGVTILGGEPFDQARAVAEVVARLRVHEISIVVYSGYTMDALLEMKAPSIDYILTHINLLIDGPFMNTLRLGSGEYRGSRNQKIIMLCESSK